MTTITGRYGGLSFEQRRAERRRRLFETALATVAEDGVSGLKVRTLSARAGLNDRYFYENFTDIAELVRELVDEQFSAATAELQNALTEAPAGTVGRTRYAFEIAVAIATRPANARLLVDTQTSEDLRRRRADLARLLAAMMLDQGAELLGSRAVRDTYAELAALTVVNGGLDVFTQWLTGDIDIDRGQLVDFLVAMVLTASTITTTVEQHLAGGRNR